MRWEKPTWIELDTNQGMVLVCAQKFVASAPNEESGIYTQQYRPPVAASEGRPAVGAIVRISRKLENGRVEQVGVLALSDEVWDDVMKNFAVAQKEDRVAPKLTLRLEVRAVYERPEFVKDAILNTDSYPLEK